MVALGTFSELQGSGLDFTSLLKEQEVLEETLGATAIPGIVSHFHHTLSNSSLSSLSSPSSSLHSLNEQAEPLAGVGVLMRVAQQL